MTSTKSTKSTKPTKSTKSDIPTLSTARFQSDRAGLIEGDDRYKVVCAVDDPNLAVVIELGTAVIPTRKGSTVVSIDTADPFLRRHRADGEALPDAWNGTISDADGSKRDAVKVALRTMKVAAANSDDAAKVIVPDTIAKFLHN